MVLTPPAFCLLSVCLIAEVDSGFEEFHILFSVYVHCHFVSPTFRMGHFAQHTSVRTCDAFNCHIGTVYVPLLVHCRIAVFVYVLGCHLSVGEQFVQPFLRRYESSFSMGSRTCVYFPSSVPASHGDLFVTTFVYTIFEI